MSRQITAAIDIAAAPEAVWAQLTDFAAYEQWNPFMLRAAGRAAVGERLEILMRAEGSRPITMKPTVLTAEPGRDLRWLGKLGFGGLFDGEHRFTLEPAPGGGTRLTQSETFRGVLVPLMPGLLKGTEASFRAFNEALKRRAESARPVGEA